MRKLALLLALVVAGAIATSALAAAGDAEHPILARSDIGDVFDPTSVKVPTGTTVHWRNESGSHNVVFNKTGQRIGGAPGTHAPSAGPWTAQFTFGSEGVFHYYCSAHSDGHFGMIGKVTAFDPNAPAPKVTHAHAKPSRFCTNRSTTCHKRGTKVLFTLDRYAKVTVTTKAGGKTKTLVKGKQRSPGKGSVKLSGDGLKPGKYVLKLRATGLNGKTSDPVAIKATVVADG